MSSSYFGVVNVFKGRHLADEDLPRENIQPAEAAKANAVNNSVQNIPANNLEGPQNPSTGPSSVMEVSEATWDRMELLCCCCCMIFICLFICLFIYLFIIFHV